MINKLVRSVRSRILNTHDHHKRIASATVMVAAFVAIGRLGMLSREMAISWKYGSSGVVDAYQIAITVTTWLPTAVVSILGVALVPTFVSLYRRGDAETSRFFGELNVAALISAIVLVGATLLALPIAASWMASELPVSTQSLAIRFTQMASPVAGMMVMIAVFACRLMARERHMNTLLEGLPGLVICLFAVGSATSAQGDDIVGGLLWGTALQLGLLIVLVRDRGNDRVGFQFGLRAQTWPLIYQAVGVLAIGQLLMSLIAPIDHFFAARIGEGAVANLGYANRILALISGLGAVAISRAILPVLSAMTATGINDQAKQITFRWAWIMVGAGLGAFVLCWPLAPYLVSILFERGAFSATDATVVASALRWGAVQLPFYFGGMVVVQLLIAAGRLREITVIAVGTILVKLLSTYFLAMFFGVSGIALATGVMYLFSGVGLSLAARAATSATGRIVDRSR